MSERERSMRVLGIDPGYAIVGWGVVEYAGNRFAPVDFGAAIFAVRYSTNRLQR